MEELCEQLEVTSFPTFRVYKAGSALGECVSSKFDKVEEFIRAYLAGGNAPAEEADQQMLETNNDATSVVEADPSTLGAVTPLMGSDDEDERESQGNKRSERDGEEQDSDQPSSKRAKTDGEIVDEANAAAVVVGDATDEPSPAMETDAPIEAAATVVEEAPLDDEMAIDHVDELASVQSEDIADPSNVEGDVSESSVIAEDGSSSEIAATAEAGINELDETLSVDDVLPEENEELEMDDEPAATQVAPIEVTEYTAVANIPEDVAANMTDELPIATNTAEEPVSAEESAGCSNDIVQASDEVVAQKLEQTEANIPKPLENGADTASADNAVAA